MRRRRSAGVNRHVTKYLAPNESVNLELHQHWARILPAIFCCGLGLFLVLLTGFAAPADLGALTTTAGWVWLVLLLHLVWRILEWRDETFVITNRRLILVHGIFVKKVAMMPLSKVTDMSYNRSLSARLLGYGTFVMESAGQEQALSTIDYVQNPDAIYRSLCGLIFGEDDGPGAPPHQDAEYWDEEPLPDTPYETTFDDAWGEDRWARDDFDAFDDHRDEEGRDDEETVRRSRHDVHTDIHTDAHPVENRAHLFRPDAESDAEPDFEVHGGSHDGRTRPMPIRVPSQRRAHRVPSRGVDDTDPYGMVTDRPSEPRQHSSVPYAEDIARERSDLDDESAWSVSHEHATRPQPVRRSRNVDPPVGHWDDA